MRKKRKRNKAVRKMTIRIEEGKKVSPKMTLNKQNYLLIRNNEFNL